MTVERIDSTAQVAHALIAKINSGSWRVWNLPVFSHGLVSSLNLRRWLSYRNTGK